MVLGSSYNSSCLEWAKDHWYLAVPIALIFGGSIIYYFNKATKKVDKKGRKNED